MEERAMMSTTIFPCRRCGKRPEYCTEESFVDDLVSHSIGCKCVPNIKSYPTQEEAIAAWNKEQKEAHEKVTD